MKNMNNYIYIYIPVFKSVAILKKSYSNPGPKKYLEILFSYQKKSHFRSGVIDID